MAKKTWEELSNIISILSRPVRMWVWMVFIIVIGMYILLTGGKVDASGILMTIVLGIFSDFGVSTITKSMEKNVKTKIEGTQKVVETTVDSIKKPIESEI